MRNWGSIWSLGWHGGNPGITPDFCIGAIVDLITVVIFQEIFLFEKAFIEPRIWGFWIDIDETDRTQVFLGLDFHRETI